LWFFL
jgi:hypothetical protein